MDVGIVGAGPSGLYLAKLIGRMHNVQIIEEDKSLGIPLHCTGLISERMAHALGLVEVVENKYDTITITTDLKHRGLTLALKRNRVVMLNRPGLENHLLSQINGVEVKLGVRALEVSRDRGIVKGSGGYVGKFDLVAIGEGARGFLAKAVVGNRPYTRVGLQADGKSRHLKDLIADEGHIIVLFGRRYSGSFFSWIVPKGDGSFRVGVVDSEGQVSAMFRRLLKITDLSPMRVFGGRVVVGSTSTIYGLGKVALIGDSTGVTKSLTGGGIVTGMLTSAILAKAIVESEGPEEAVLRYNRAMGTLGSLSKIYTAISRALYSNIEAAEVALEGLDGGYIEVDDYDNHLEAIVRILAGLRGFRHIARALTMLNIEGSLLANLLTSL